MVTAAAPASCTRRARSGALRRESFQPARILTVTGILTARVMARTTSAACSGSRIRLQPALCLAIFGTEQPMLTSTISAPMPSTICAAAAIFSGSPPKIWIETGRSSSVYSAYSSVRSIPRTSPSELTISLTTRPHPPFRFTSRRNAVSVMPAIGARANGGVRSIDPIFISSWTSGTLIRFHIRRVDFDADCLTDEINREHQPSVRAFSQQSSDDPLQRSVDHFHHHSFVNERARIELQIALNQPADPFDLEFGDRCDLAVERHDIHHAGARENRQPFFRIESRETIPGEERPVDLLLPIFP